MNEQNNKMKTCSTCGKEIAKSAKICTECGAKIKKPFYKRGWFIVLCIIIVIGIISSAGNENTQQTQSPSNTEQQETPIQYTVYTVDEMVKDLESNALNAENKYANQYVEITGKLTNIDSDGDYISLSPSDDIFTFTSVQCYIKNDEQKAQVMQMSTDDIITLKGKITSIGEVMGYSLNIDSIN